MKHLLLVSLSFVMFSSCSRTIYQVTEFAYTGENGTEAPNITDHEDITVTYDLDDPSGRMAFTVANRLDQSIIIDFSRSSLVAGNTNFPYYENIANTNFSATTLDYGLIETIRGTAFTQFDQAQVTIAPRSEMTFQKFILRPPEYPDSLKKLVSSHQLATFEPFSFRHYLSYRVDQPEAPQVLIEDEFEAVSVKMMGDVFFEGKKSRLTNLETSTTMKVQEKISPIGPILLLGTLVAIIVVNSD